MKINIIKTADIPSLDRGWGVTDLMSQIGSLESDEAVEVVLEDGDPSPQSFYGKFNYHKDAVKGFKCITRDGVPYIVRDG